MALPVNALPRSHRVAALCKDGLLLLLHVFLFCVGEHRLSEHRRSEPRRCIVRHSEHCRGAIAAPALVSNGNRLWLLVWIGSTIGDRSLGGAEGTRTPDPLNAIEMRSQLRYSPILPVDGIRLSETERPE